MKEMKKSVKILGMAMIFLFLLTLTYAERTYTRNKKPTIKVEFKETVIITNSSLVREGTSGEIGLTTRTENNITFLFQPANDITDGDYVFRVSAVDKYGNPLEGGYAEKNFTVDTTPPALTIISPQEGARYNTSNISFSFSFSENVTLLNFSITDEPGRTKDSFDPTTGNFFLKTFTLEMDGDKTVNIGAQDKAGNKVSGSLRFSMEAYPMKIWISSPKFGYANETPFDLTIKTDEYARCNYSFTGFPVTYFFNQSNGYEHKKQLGDIGKNTPVYVECLDVINQQVIRETFNLTVDKTKPSILEAYADPDVITESPFITIIYAKTDDKTVCKYSDDSSASYIEMSGFDDFNEDYEPSYNRTNKATIDSGLYNGEEYTYYIICKNLAQTTSDKTSVSFKVDVPEGPTIYIHRPTGTTNQSKTFFNITTNMAAYACYNDSDENPFEGGTEITKINPKSFVSSLFTVSQGTHTYYIGCRFYTEEGPEDQIAETTLKVDLTPPSTPIVNDSSRFADPEYTYLTDKLYAEWRSEDNETGVTEYMYSIYNYNTAEKILDWTTTTDTSEWASGLNLTDGQKYYFKVKAKNAVGMWSSAGESNGVTVDTSSVPETCSDNITNQNETDKDCGGICGPCADGKDCLNNSDCKSSSCNNGVCGEASCSDKVKNQGESDVDCGGTCAKCDEGEKCGSDYDCKSGDCDSYTKTCNEDACSNNVKDSGETDVDCGGTCKTKCRPGDSCKSNSDCTSSYCENNVCKANDQDSDSDGMPDVWEVSHGLNPNDSSDANEDPDNDGYTNLQEYQRGTNPFVSDSTFVDSDSDGMPDDWEQRYGLNPNYDDSEEDLDGEDLLNLQEYNVRNTWGASTDPTLPDTDSDGCTDKKEMDSGTNPLDGTDCSKSSTFVVILLVLIILAVLGAIGYLVYTQYYLKGKGFRPKKGFGGFSPPPFMRETFPPREPFPQKGSRPKTPMQTPQRTIPNIPIREHELFQKRAAEKSALRQKTFAPFALKTTKPLGQGAPTTAKPTQTTSQTPKPVSGIKQKKKTTVKKTIKKSQEKTATPKSDDIFKQLKAISRKKTVKKKK